jgi:GPH family glycoside/pentoside/hexuronide:cation symporter
LAAPVPQATLALYAFPVLGPALLNTLALLYLFKYATDVLLIAPAAMGWVFMIGRFWDAASDPLVGYWSDRTRTRWGRRRPWFAAAVPLFAICPVMVWSPPAGLGEMALLVWVAAGMLALDTATTAFLVPHGALGAELSLEHHERTRIFAWRQLGNQLGFFAAIAAMTALASTSDKRALAFWIAAGAGALTALSIALAGLGLRERPDFQLRGMARPFAAIRDVWRNSHARTLLAVLLIEHLGLAGLAVIAPFYVQYVLGDESLLAYLMASYLIPTLIAAPFAPAVSRRWGKRRTWLVSMCATGCAYAGLFFAHGENTWLVYVLGTVIGLGNGIGIVVGTSLQADVVDYDEYLTGERKEGTYFAAWNIARKGASGVMGFLAGQALQLSGFVPNAEQSEPTRLVIRSLLALVPAAAFALGIALFLRFQLTQTEHDRIREAIRSRAAAGPSAS